MTQDRDISPKRRKLDTPLIQPESNEATSSKESHSTMEIIPETDEEDKLIEHLLQKAKQNLKSNPFKSTQPPLPYHPRPPKTNLVSYLPHPRTIHTQTNINRIRISRPH